MRKVINILLVLVLCLSLAVTAFATDDEFVISPGEDGTPCDHAETELKDKKNPTCTAAGHTGVLMCCLCGEVLDEGSEIPALGHKFNEDGICTVCGVSDVPKTGDASNMILWVGLMAMSAAALVAVTGIRRKEA